MTADWTEARIAALIDGSVEDPAEAARLAEAIATDPEAAAAARRIEALNAALRKTYPLPETEPMPAAIAAAIHGAPGKVTALPRRRRPRMAALALAASLLLAVGVGAVIWPKQDGRDIAGLVPVVADLHRALETLPSGQISAQGVQPMLSFRDGAGRICREFERLAEGGPVARAIACRTGDGRWQVEGRVDLADAAAPADDGYLPADGTDGATLDPVLDRLQAGPPLTPEAEAALIGSDWQTRP